MILKTSTGTDLLMKTLGKDFKRARSPPSISISSVLEPINEELMVPDMSTRYFKNNNKKIPQVVSIKPKTLAKKVIHLNNNKIYQLDKENSSPKRSLFVEKQRPNTVMGTSL